MKELYPWQKKAANCWWKNGFKGVIQAVTGSGKTMLALAIIQELRKKIPNLKIIIVVPTVALLDQWVRLIHDELEISMDNIGTFWAKSKDIGKPFVVTTYISAAKSPANSPTFSGFIPKA